MNEMTHKERVLAILNREPVDRFPWCDSLWGETRTKYIEEGSLKEDEDTTVHFDMSIRSAGWVSGIADLDFEDEVVEEDDETILKINGNGAQLRWWKERSGTPEHVDFAVKERPAWEERVKPHLLEVDKRRIPFEGYAEQRAKAADENRAFCWSGVAPFEQMHPVCGHEYMLMGMALDPDWVKDMVMTYADMTIMHLDVLFAKEGKPDFMWFYEDMGFKERPFMSPAMYEDIVQPGHKKLFDYAHDNGCKVVVHSCGFVEPLVPGLIEAGMDCLQAMEVKAGMDLVHLAKTYGDKISFCGGLDIREIGSNDRARIDAELNAKMPAVIESGAGFMVHSDHSIPPDVDHDSLVYFFEQGSKMADPHTS
jgi:uroporphyrinogen decarboxylase